ncbi:MAG: hypothetical protein RLP02_32420, partial [Coleofasciculus sp. C2-GNP5-27]
ENFVKKNQARFGKLACLRGAFGDQQIFIYPFPDQGVAVPSHRRSRATELAKYQHYDQVRIGCRVFYSLWRVETSR